MPPNIICDRRLLIDRLRPSAGFIQWLDGIGYFQAPSSVNHHGNWPGGLYAHSVMVAETLNMFTEKLNLQWDRPQSPWIVGLLHDICKTDDYIWRNDPINPDIRYNPNKFMDGHGTKSVAMLRGHFDLTEQEKQCIIHHMGAFTDKSEWNAYSQACAKDQNVLYTHTADMVASQVKGI